MAALNYYNRDVYTLSGSEIIGFIDFIFDSVNIDIIENVLHHKNKDINIPGKLNYRKIEVLKSIYEWQIILKVSFGWSNYHYPVITAFTLDNGSDDFYLTTVNSVNYKAAFLKKETINFDFSSFLLGSKNLYQYLNDILKMYGDDFEYSESFNVNPFLQNMLDLDVLKSYVVEEWRLEDALIVS